MSNYDDDEDKDSNYLKLSGDFDQLKHGSGGLDKAAARRYRLATKKASNN